MPSPHVTVVGSGASAMCAARLAADAIARVNAVIGEHGARRAA